MNSDSSLYGALNAVKVLRCSVGQIFSSLANGLSADHGEEGRDQKFLSELEELLGAVTQNLRDVEQAVNSLASPPGPFSLGNSSFLSQECSQERQALYSQLVLSYKWTDKIHEYSNHAFSLLSQNSLKRSYSMSSAKRRRTITSNHNIAPHSVDAFISSLDRQFPDMSITISRPFTTNVVLQITLARVLQAVVSFKGLLIEWAIIKGHGEQFDLWTESRHKVFRKITENSLAAILHYYAPPHPEYGVHSFIRWLHSYINLFNDPCKRCGNHLHCALPPTWRDMRTLEPYHEECK